MITQTIMHDIGGLMRSGEWFLPWEKKATDEHFLTRI